jgi:hypothetical protein
MPFTVGMNRLQVAEKLANLPFNTLCLNPDVLSKLYFMLRRVYYLHLGSSDNAAAMQNATEGLRRIDQGIALCRR